MREMESTVPQEFLLKIGKKTFQYAPITYFGPCIFQGAKLTEDNAFELRSTGIVLPIQALIEKSSRYF